MRKVKNGTAGKRHNRPAPSAEIHPVAAGTIPSSVLQIAEALTVMGDSAASVVKYTAETIEAAKKAGRAAKPIANELAGVVRPVIRRATKTMDDLKSSAKNLATRASKNVKRGLARTSTPKSKTRTLGKKTSHSVSRTVKHA